MPPTHGDPISLLDSLEPPPLINSTDPTMDQLTPKQNRENAYTDLWDSLSFYARHKKTQDCTGYHDPWAMYRTPARIDQIPTFSSLLKQYEHNETNTKPENQREFKQNKHKKPKNKRKKRLPKANATPEPFRRRQWKNHLQPTQDQEKARETLRNTALEDRAFRVFSNRPKNPLKRRRNDKQVVSDEINLRIAHSALQNWWDSLVAVKATWQQLAKEHPLRDLFEEQLQRVEAMKTGPIKLNFIYFLQICTMQHIMSLQCNPDCNNKGFGGIISFKVVGTHANRFTNSLVALKNGKWIPPDQAPDTPFDLDSDEFTHLSLVLNRMKITKKVSREHWRFAFRGLAEIEFVNV